MPGSKRTVRDFMALIVALTVSGLLVSGAAIAAGDGHTLATQTDASDIICTAMNHPVDPTGDGTELNFETGEVEDGFLVVSGAHFNPWKSGGNLAFFWMNGGGGAGDGNQYVVLSPGDTIGSGSFGGTGMDLWRAGAEGYLGIRFNCTTAGTCYGYMHFTTASSAGFPAILGDYCWNAAGDPITIPDAHIFTDRFED